jgi:transposase-like protein
LREASSIGRGWERGRRAGEHASWRELLVDLKARGLAIAAELATGDRALEKVSPTTRHQRCTVHKTANVLDKMPKSVRPAAKADLREILDGARPGNSGGCGCNLR